MWSTLCAALVFATVLWTDQAQSRHLPGTPTVLPRDDDDGLQGDDTAACAQVNAQWAAQKAANASASVVVDGQLAYDCLNSVPLHADNAVRLVRAIQPFLEWHTTSSYLKDPPEGYPFPPFDIDAAYEDIVRKIQAGEYANEYQFQSDLFLTFSSAKDGHFRFFPDLLTAVIGFRRGNLSLVSVSLDGTLLPQIYVLSDIQRYNSDRTFTPSPVSALNGQDPVAANKELSQLGILADHDALYNSMFHSPALFAWNQGNWQGLYGGSGRFAFVWPGPNTAVEFENGTVVHYPTVARVVGDFANITDGPSFYAKYCSGTRPATAVATPTPTPTPTPAGNLTAAPPAGYPTPVVITSDQSTAGFFLPDTDVAVLSVFSFSPTVPAEFQRAVQLFLEDAKAAGKTKLVVDLSANSGGWVLQGHDTFRQLFPQTQQDAFNRFRSSDLLQIAGRQFSGVLPPGFDPETSSNATLINIHKWYPNYRYDLDINNNSFTSAQQKFATDTFYGDNFTQIHRWNFNEPMTTINRTFGIGFDVTGYRSRRNFTQPFAAEDIILLYDGWCASTCSLFSEFLRLHAGVRSVTFGGRPELDEDGNVPLIQNYGGTRGSNNNGYNYCNDLARISLAAQGDAVFNTTSGPVALTPPEVAILTQNLDTYALNRSTSTSLNLRDHILRDNLAEGLPAQFVFEPTDCRLFYTPLSIVDPVEQWRLVAEAAWGDGACVAGGLQRSGERRRLKRGVEAAAAATARVKMGKVVRLPHLAPESVPDAAEAGGVPTT